MTADIGFEPSRTKRYLILANACIATFMATLDGSIVNIALPVISQHFSVDINTIQWVVTAYLLAISSVMLIWGKLSDLYGKKWLFAIGIGVFTIGSLLCGMSWDFTTLVAARVLQAIGASIMMALTQGIVSAIFPLNERGKALGIVGTVVAVGSLVGPAAGGIIVASFGWRAIFYINIPFGIAGVILTALFMREPPSSSPRSRCSSYRSWHSRTEGSLHC
jgi:MFS family permease